MLRAIEGGQPPASPIKGLSRLHSVPGWWIGKARGRIAAAAEQARQGDIAGVRHHLTLAQLYLRMAIHLGRVA